MSDSSTGTVRIRGSPIAYRRETEISRDCAGAMTDGDLVVECEQFLGRLLNSYYRKAA
jgi:hypothetical protein